MFPEVLRLLAYVSGRAIEELQIMAETDEQEKTIILELTRAEAINIEVSLAYRLSVDTLAMQDRTRISDLFDRVKSLVERVNRDGK